MKTFAGQTRTRRENFEDLKDMGREEEGADK